MSSARIYIATLLAEQGDTGVQTHFNAFADYVIDQGGDVEIVTPYGADAWFFYPLYALRGLIQRLHAPAGVRWYRGIRLLSLRWRLWRRLRREPAALVYAQCPVSAAAGLQARQSPQQAVFMVAHFNVSQADEWAGQGLIRTEDATWRSIREFEARVLPRLDGIVFVSRFMQRTVCDRIPAIAEVRQQVLPNFVQDPGVPLRRPASQPGCVRLVAIGTLEPRKNQRYLLDVFAAARAQCPGLHLTVIGEGPDRLLLEAHARALGVAGSVQFAGRVAQAGATLGEFDACIHTARMENLPIILIEAMSHALPVLACPVGGIPELFSDGVEGRYLPLDDALEAGSAVAALCNSPELRERMGLAARSRFVQGYSRHSVAGNLRRFLGA